MMYLKVEIWKLLLVKMFIEIFEIRVMVKSGMKKDKDDKILQQFLNNRQFVLKLFVNVIYGYILVLFFGRMFCFEIVDSIVQIGCEMFERVIVYIYLVE